MTCSVRQVSLLPMKLSAQFFRTLLVQPQRLPRGNRIVLVVHLNLDAVGDLLPTMNAPLFLRGAFLQVDSLILFVFFFHQLFGKFRHALMMNPKIC